MKRVLLPISILIVAVFIFMILVMTRMTPEKRSEPQPDLLVQVMDVNTQTISYQVESQGTVRPKLRTELVSEVNGRVVNVAEAFVEGGYFKQGDVLIRVEQGDYVSAVKSAQADLARARASLEEEKARAKVAEEEWASIAKDEANAPELYLRKPQLARELANVRSAEAALERARRDLSRTEIRAPYDGLVKSKTVDLGQFISRGTSLGNIVGTELAEVRLPLTDNDLAYIQLPDDNKGRLAVKLSTKIAGKLQSWNALLVRSEGVLDEQSRVVYAVAQVRDPYNRLGQSHDSILRFGRFVEASIEADSLNELVVLPRGNLRIGDRVVVVTPENTLDVRDVTVARADDKNVYISAGLNPGERVSLTPIANPINGMKVILEGEREGAADSAEVAKAGVE